MPNTLGAAGCSSARAIGHSVASTARTPVKSTGMRQQVRGELSGTLMVSTIQQVLGPANDMAVQRRAREGARRATDVPVRCDGLTRVLVVRRADGSKL